MKSGTGLVLGAVGALAVASALGGRRRRGGRATEEEPYVPSEEQITALIEELKDVQTFRGRARRVNGEWYAFNIKANRYDIPEGVKDAIGEEAMYQEIGDLATQEIESFVEHLRDSDYPWIDTEWTTTGRSGGWLLLRDNERTIGNLEEQADVHRPIPTLVGNVPSPEDAEEMRKMYAHGQALVRAIAEIHTQVAAAVKGYERYISDFETWAPIVEGYGKKLRKPKKRSTR